MDERADITDWNRTISQHDEGKHQTTTRREIRFWLRKFVHRIQNKNVKEQFRQKKMIEPHIVFQSLYNITLSDKNRPEFC